MHTLSQRFLKEIKMVINRIFPKLNAQEKSMLIEYTTHAIGVFGGCNSVSSDQLPYFEHQFRINNYRDLTVFVLNTLPYINDPNDIHKKSITSLDDIYKVKKDSTSTPPSYLYSNIQYNRGERLEDSIREVTFNKQHYLHNMHLLLETIQVTANKFYTNWIQTEPLTLQEYKKHTLYIETQKNFIEGKLPVWDPADGGMFERTGLYIGDIYNTIVNEFYYAIKNSKWLLYDLRIGANIYPMTTILGNVLPLKECLNGKRWNRVPSVSRDLFKQEWNGLIEAAFLSSSYGKFSSIIVSRVVKTIGIFFNKYYKDKSKAKQEGYKEFKLEDITTDTLSEDTGKDISEHVDENVQISRMKSHIQSIPIHHLYEYFRTEFEVVKNSFYHVDAVMKEGKPVFKGLLYKLLDDGTLDFYSLTEESGTYVAKEAQISVEVGSRTIPLRISPKNLYNFGKSMCHRTVEVEDDGKTDNKWIEVARYWCQLPKKFKNEMLDRLNVKNAADIGNWFNIKGYYRRLYGDMGLNMKELNDGIAMYILGGLIDFVFMSLIRRGVLTKFVLDSNLTDSKLLPSNNSKRIGKIKERLAARINKKRDDYLDCFYYLTGTQYRNMPQQYNTKKHILQDYFDFMTDPQEDITWPTMYTLDWMSQLFFYHHFINNRVTFITAGTGTGKSTQVPKLYAYALKMIEYKNDGKVLVTVPRINVVTGVSDWVSKELGVPTKEYSFTKKDHIASDNYSMQFKYSGDSHEEDTGKLMIKFTTDGGYVHDAARNPLRKAQVTDSKGEKVKSYGTKNTYDVVIVDEAHEHNTNMDLIVTLERYTTYYNNEARFVILSATIDDDEPVYRRYFRDVNDNLMFPLNTWLQESGLDRINVDRRLHMSIPGQTTRFKIKEVYHPEGDPLQVTLDIVGSGDAGDILLFQPGQSDIIKSVEFLNKNTPNYVLALPYYRDQKKADKPIVDKIDEASNRYKITVAKEDINSPARKNLFTGAVSPGTYKQFIIVATNIAEASISITSLRFIVDTGTNKTNFYDPETRDDRLITKRIPEASRLQRKGRIGRTAPGTAHYIYGQGECEKMRKSFGIAVQDVTGSVYELLAEDSKEDPLIPTDIDFVKMNKKAFKNAPKMVQEMLEYSYMLAGKLYTYTGVPEYQDLDKATLPPARLQTGYSAQTLLDRNLSFFIVHPDELLFKRSILGKFAQLDEREDTSIVTVDETNKGHLDSKKLHNTISTLKGYQLVDVEEPLLKLEEGKMVVSGNVQKTELAEHTDTIKDNFKLGEDMELSDVMSIIHSIRYNCFEEMVAVVTMLETTSKVMNNWFGNKMVNGKALKTVDEFKGLYGNQYGDPSALLKIYSTFIQSPEWKSIINSLVTVQEEYLKYKILYYKWIPTMKRVVDIPPEIPEKVFVKLSKLDRNGILEDTTSFSEKELRGLKEEEYSKESLLLSLKRSEDKINSWAKAHYVDEKTLGYFIKSLCRQIPRIENFTSKHRGKIPFEEVSSVLPITSVPDSLDRKISMALMHGYSFKVAKKITKTPFYVNINSIDTVNLLGLTPAVRFLPNTTDTTIKQLTELVMYLGQEFSEGTMTTLMNVYPDMEPLLIKDVTSPDFKKLQDRIKDAAKDTNKLISNGAIGSYYEALVYIRNLVQKKMKS